MKIVAPVSSLQEVEMLLHFGAEELYCGVRTPEWEAHFGGNWWMNRRSPSGANLSSWEEVRQVVRLAQGAKVPVHVTLNAPFYTEGGIRYLLKLTEKLVHELAIDSIIVSDLSFLIRLSRLHLPVRVHVSSLGSCLNSRSVAFYQSLGVQRVILPRQLRLSEIRRIVTDKGSQMEFEVFAVNDGCYYEEGFCQTTHVLGGPFCLTDWKVEVRGSTEGGISTSEIAEGLQHLKEYLWYQNNCGSSLQESGFPNGPCSLCWFGHFRDWGVTSVKIVGREASFARKMGSLQIVKAVMDEVRGGTPAERIADFALSVRRTPEYCGKGYMCYFREQ